MTTVREFFAVEADECLAGIDRLLEAAEGGVDPTELLRLSRTLRGSAQLAREERIALAARALEAVARAVVSRVVTWGPALEDGARATVVDLRALVAGTEPANRADERVDAILARWATAPVRIPGLPAGPGSRPPGPGHHGREPGAANNDPELRAFATRQGAVIADELAAALAVLARQPWNRDSLKRILRRQRALLGAAWLDAFPSIAEAVRAIDAVCRLVARKNVAVADDWWAVFDAARAVLTEALADLARGEPTGTAPSLARLRALRDGLGAGPDAAAGTAGAGRPRGAPAGPGGPPAPAGAVAGDARWTEAAGPAADGSTTGAAPRGEAALYLALGLRSAIERAVGDDMDGRALVADLFDLIQRGLR